MAFYVAAIIITALFIGLRYEVGGDWAAYQHMYETIFFLSLRGSLGVTDAGYAAVNWFAAQTGLGIALVNVTCAAIFMVGLGYLAWRQPNPALALLVAVPYLIFVVSMGYTRQAAAIGFICLAVANSSEKSIWKIIVLIGLAALFHKTAILILPLLLIPILRRNIIYGAMGFLTFVIIFVAVLRDNSDQLVANYVQSDYDSQGALIRVSMNVIASILFILLNKKIELPSFQKSYWMASAVLSLFSIPALALSSASAGVDRISLYLIPLQIIVYARLPYTLSNRGRALPSVLIGVIAYCFLVQFVWLNYADNASYWLPYKSIMMQ